jgi:3-methyladenine DNA glycosylase AlkD
LKADYHRFILDEIQRRANKATRHTFLDAYLGNSHPRYAIDNPTLRAIAREFMKSQVNLSADEFARLLTSLVQGKSGTEKMMAGILLDYSRLEQRKFKIKLFDDWLNELEGWAEIDTLCTGKYAQSEILAQWQDWERLLKKFSRSKDIGKRRASLVFLCVPVRYSQVPELADLAFGNIQRLCGERDILITKAISWLLRSMIKLYRDEVMSFVEQHEESLPAIAVRETRTKLSTGVKGKRRTG